MADVTVISRGTTVRGRVTGDGNLEILGFVEGEVEVSGEVTVGEEGLVGSNLSGRRIVIRGAVRGDISAEEALSLEAGARVVGDLRAPRIAIAAGALVRGHVQTSDAGRAPAAKGRTQVAAAPISRPRLESPAAAPARPAAAPARAPARPAPAPAAAPKPAAHASAASNGSSSRNANGRPAVKAPPAPVVPVLKKGVKGAMKKRAGG